MRFGTQTGSLISHVMTTSAQPKPEIGMPATLCGWTDRYPGTVVEVVAKPGKPVFVTIQEDDAKAPAGVCNTFTEMQTWEYTANPNGCTYTFRQRADGKWEEVRKSESGRWSKTGAGRGLVLGRREKYRDPSF